MQILTNVTFRNVPILIQPLDLNLYHIHRSCVFLKKRTTVIHPGNHAGCFISPKADRNSRRLKLSISEISDNIPLFWHSHVMGYFKAYK